MVIVLGFFLVARPRFLQKGPAAGPPACWPFVLLFGSLDPSDAWNVREWARP